MKSLKSSIAILTFLCLGAMTMQAQLLSSLEKIQNTPLHAGISRTYGEEYKSVIKTAREVMVESGLIMEYTSKIDDETYMLIGKTRAGGFSWGELVRVVVIKDKPSETTVRVLTNKKVKLNVTAKGDYSNSILSGMDMKFGF